MSAGTPLQLTDAFNIDRSNVHFSKSGHHQANNVMGFTFMREQGGRLDIDCAPRCRPIFAYTEQS